MQGIIRAVCTSPVGGIPKFNHVIAIVAQYGLEGDHHCRPERHSYRRNIEVPNIDRHLLLVSEEVKRHIFDTVKKIEGGKFGFLQHGSLAENLLIRGIEIDQLSAGTMLSIRQGEVLLRVVEPAKPCRKLRTKYGLPVYQALQDCRGMYCVVHHGIGQKIYPADPIEVVPGGEAALADPQPKDSPMADAAELKFEGA